MASNRSQSAIVHEQLDHPVIDCDGHILELEAVVADYVRDLAGPEMADRFLANPGIRAVLRQGEFEQSLDERRDAWSPRGAFWNLPSQNTLDRATATLPGLMYERLDEMGIDLSILYPSLGLMAFAIAEDDLRQATCQAFNAYFMDLLTPYSDRLLPVALIPMQTPDEAIAALEHAVSTLGYKAVVMQQTAGRVVPRLERDMPMLAPILQRPDNFGLDSALDYDPVWSKCVELGVAATFHGMGSTAGFGMPASVSSMVATRMGALGTAHHRLATNLFMGGVPRRFPSLNFAFQEGGVVWACSLLSDLVGHWEKRNLKALETMDPANLDVALFIDLVEKHGDARTIKHLDDIRAYASRAMPKLCELDEFVACGIEKPEQIVDQFTARFYFGCEGDDPLYATAFRSEMLPFDSTLKAIYGSDISHWDVPDMAECLEEAYEPVESGAITVEQLREFLFVNPVRLHGEMNPRFFEGTRVEAAAADVLGGATT